MKFEKEGNQEFFKSKEDNLKLERKILLLLITIKIQKKISNNNSPKNYFLLDNLLT